MEAVNLNRLAYFAAVVDTGSFTRAAERLGITKTVVSQQVAKLEDELKTALLMRTTPTDDDEETWDYWYGVEVVRWNRVDNVIEPLYDMFDFADPRTDMFPYMWNKLGPSGCSGEARVEGPEYHHVSAVATGSQGNILVTSRELATVWSLGHGGDGVQWTLSSRLRSLQLWRHER